MAVLKSLTLSAIALLSTLKVGSAAPVSTSHATVLPNITTAPPTNLGQWGKTIEFPLVPVAAALVPETGDLLIWSAYNASTFMIGRAGKTQTALYSPSTGTVKNYTVTNTGHDMFCPGLSTDFYGRQIVTGGDTAARTSIYNATTNTWEAAADMLVSRGYQSQTTLSDGNIFTIGGSWSGGLGGKIGEVYDTKLNEWWSLPGCKSDALLTNDAQGIYRQDNHAWIFSWKAGFVFQAGPSIKMNWYHTGVNGTTIPAGVRGTSPTYSDAIDSMNGNAVMYDAVAGKILTAGGSPSYQNSPAHSSAHIITIAEKPIVASIAPMTYPRAFANAIVLPDGSVFIAGGQSYAVPFSDNSSILTPELWNPTTQIFTPMATLPTPRNYHSVGLLMPDATIFSAGGGLCGTCDTNHFDGQFYSPPYLFLSDGKTPAPRPIITSLSAPSVEVGDKFSVITSDVVSSFSLMRVSATTHTVNTDQRRVALLPQSVDQATNNYTLHLPASPGVVIPGYWMLFALNAAGTPSIAKTIKITNYHLPYDITDGTGEIQNLNLTELEANVTKAEAVNGGFNISSLLESVGAPGVNLKGLNVSSLLLNP